MIECSNLIKTYGRGANLIRAVDEVSCTIVDGSFVLIGGRSGSGKTTLLSMIGGLTRPTQGTVRIDKCDIWANSDAKLSNLRASVIGFVFQFSGLLPTLTVAENVMLPALFKQEKVDVKQNTQDLIHYVGLDSKVNSYPSKLSGGETKRVAIARALINNPKILLADEPTGDLDVETEKEIMNLFAEINSKGTTILMVTHNLDLSVYANQSLRMDRGKITVDRTSEKVEA